MLQKLSGKRTYLTGWLMLVAALLLWWQGALPATDAAHWIFEGLGLIFLRAGVHKAVPNATDLVEALLNVAQKPAAEDPAEP